jgi:Fic family protein
LQLHPRTAANLADLVRMMNCYYSNLIEGHNTLPRDIERALATDLDQDEARRNLQVEAVAHVRVQREVDRLYAVGDLPEPASTDFLRWLHRAFYRDAPEALLTVRGAERSFRMAPGEFRSRPEHDNVVGRHLPPSSGRVAAFMAHFERRFRLAPMGKGSRILAMAAAHHRLNYIHPFPDGNGRVSRLMSHAMGLQAGIGAHGLWSVSRGLARGLESRSEYKRMMDHADSPRQGGLDGRGNLSARALTDFTEWFLRVALDQVAFMGRLFDLETLGQRLRRYAAEQAWRPEAATLLETVLVLGEVPRGDAPRLAALKERSGRQMLSAMTADGILGSDTPKGPVSLRFPIRAVERLFPQLFAEI